MRKTVTPMLSLVVILTLVLAACGPTQPPAPPSVVCVNFEPPRKLGDQFGAPVPQNPGDLAFTANGIPVKVWDFRLLNGSQTFGSAQIDSAPVPFNSKQSIRTNNINLEFDFSQIGFQTAQVDFEFLDLGGIENISVDGNPNPIYAGELVSATNPIGAINWIIAQHPVPSGRQGTMMLYGAIKTLRIGGEEFWIDNVCARQFRTQAIGCVDFTGFPDNTTFGNPFNINGYHFTGLGAAPFVNVSGNVVGLQFADGLEVDLPGPVSAVTLDVASFSKEIDVYAIDSNNQAVANVLVPGDKLVHNIQLSGQDIVKIMLKGGGREGILVKICS